jgi:hypothetical protein
MRELLDLDRQHCLKRVCSWTVGSVATMAVGSAKEGQAALCHIKGLGPMSSSPQLGRTAEEA